jgi:WD40 repeat protein
MIPPAPQPQQQQNNTSTRTNIHQNHATYADLRRRWSVMCPPDHLPRLLQAVAATNNSTTTSSSSSSSSGSSSSRSAQANLLNLGSEIRTQHRETGGRTLMEANNIIVLDGAGNDDDDDVDIRETASAATSAATTTTTTPPDASVLQPPVLMGGAATTTVPKGSTNPLWTIAPPPPLPPTATTTTATTTTVSSSLVQSATSSATLMRHFLQLRDTVQQAAHQIRTLQKSLLYQEETRVDLIQQQRDKLLLVQQQQQQQQQQSTVPGAAVAATTGGSSSSMTNHSYTSNGSHHHHHHHVQLDDIRDAQLQSERVTHSLQRQLASLQSKYAADEVELRRAETLARLAFQASKHVLTSYRDPFLVSASSSALGVTGNGAGGNGLAGNRLMLHIHARQVGLSRSCGSGNNTAVALLRQPLATGHSGARSTLTDIRKSLLLYHRLSHAATINTHLNYPIYCLRFDRTGRYFVTGADDYLAKVFCLGDYVNGKSVGCGGGVMLDNVHSNDIASHHAHRGAVLVCTLRGHAGVINDIDVSSDNAFLATASEDGDCRVWGLANGCPIAILRGHVGGANMVKWSMLTPYRLVTAGADGLARTWDIKEACLKRYGKWVGKRAEYKRPFVPIVRVPPPPPPTAAAATAASISEQNAPPEEGRGDTAAAAFLDAAPPPPIVPLPPPPADVPLVPLPLPPLPPGAVPIGGGQVLPLPPPPAGRDDGRFKAGDTIDEGVKLLSKMQHGAAVDERLAISPGTRSRRAPVKVLCVALCPLGGHFVTGADDGICRVFSAADDEAVRLADFNHCKNTSIFDGGSGSDVHGGRSKSSRRTAPPGKLLLSLKGHLSAVTDLEYSSGGDRILSASQKDGVVHIWSWSDDLLACSSGGSSSSVGGSLLAATSPATGMTPNCHVSKILIKLTNPNAPSAEFGGGGRPAARRRVNRASSASITCDVAHWLHDDTKILTSQSQAAKQNEIQPGSQYFFLWDSITGHCLLGISGGHTMQCPVVIPHPMDVSIFCSAGADGVVKFWDLETGSCVLSHRNTVDFGPVEPRDVGKISGYLDGSFSPDGASLVLTDDCGRITVFDSLADSFTPKESTQRENPPWIKEQYFANDYYDLLYDAHGYCIEKGSERPPHLAPRGVRCSFSGAAWPATVELAFKALRGPLPCPENEARWKRLEQRSKPVMSVQGVQRRRGNIVSQFEPQNTVMVGLEAKKPEVIAEENAATNQAARSPRLSSNWRWGDYADILREEVQDDEEDADDASYDAEATNAARASRANRRIARQNRSSQNDHENDDSDSDSEDSEAESVDNRVAAGTQPSRASSRGRRQVYVDGQASSDEDDEIVSTHNTPSGPFVADYDIHYFRFPNEATADSIRRHWVQRAESTSSYSGRKCYTPQINDDVVYIPRAHADTIAQFPSLTAPWQSWPERDVWPVVRCRVRSLRYRFPFKAYFGGRNRTGPRCESIVVILTLEVTGIPEALSDERDFAWPKPSFIEPPSSPGHIFQVSMFENEEMDFIIPLGLYQNRLAKLEESLSRNEYAEVEVFYGSNEGLDDGDFVSFKGTVVAQAAVDDDGDPNLCGSGYGSLTIQWEDGSDDHACSPWELVALESTTILDVQRPKLSAEEKKTIRKALSVIRAMEGVKALFDQPVNTRRCSDYESRVEVPMSLSFVKTRLDRDYYATRLSVVADVALISTNCWKYNGESELTQVAREMSEKFMDVVLSPDEKTSFLDFQAALVANAPQRAPDANDDDGDADDPDTAQGTRRSSRRPASSRSALENLPPPAGRPRASTAVRSIRLRTSSQATQRPRRDNNRSTRTGPSVLESPLAQPPPPGPLNGGNRGRATSMSSGQAPRGRQLRSASTNVPVPNGNSRAQRSIPIPSGGNDDSPSSHTRGATRSAAGHAEAAPPLPRRAAAVSRPIPAPSAARGSPRGAATSARQSSRGAAVARRSMADDSSAEEENAESEYEEEDHDDEGSIDHQERPSATRTRRGSRSSARRAAAAESSQEDDGDSSADNSDSDTSEAEQRRPKRASRPGSSRAAAARPTAGRATRRSSQPSDDEDLSDENGSVEENQRRRSNQLESPGSARRSTRRQQLKQSFVEPGSSEFSDNFDEDDESDEEERKPARKRGKTASAKSQKKKTAHRKRPPPDQGKRPAKRRKNNNSSDDDDDDDDDDINQRPWPKINIKHITKVGKSLLQKLGDLDSDNVFAIPVTEAFPEVGSSYGEVIEQPMDFRTIVEERMPMYQSIQELQDDLILVFRNCIEFNNNDPSSPYVGLAK